MFKVRRLNLSRKTAHCPRCGTLSKRHSVLTRRVREIGINAPTVLDVTRSKHYCPVCDRHFSMPMEHIALPGARFSNRVRRMAVDLVRRDGKTLEQVATAMQQRHFVHIPATTLHDWVAAETAAMENAHV